jgi:mono/diheme cytochrome c family protein
MRSQLQQSWARAPETSTRWLGRRTCSVLVAVAWLIGLQTAIVVGLPSLARAEPAPREGEKLYQQFCVSCHTIGGGRLVGPDLKGVTERRSHEWLVRFITDPERMRQDDPIAIANLKQFGVPMPRLGLTEQQVTALLAYVKTAQAVPTGTPAQYIPTLVLSLVVVAVFTLIGLIAGTKKIDGGVA